MKKILIIAFVIIFAFSMSGCSKIIDKVGEKIEEKAEEKIDEIIEKVDDEAGKTKSKEDKKVLKKEEKESKKSEKNKDKKKNESGFDIEGFLSGIDLGLKDEKLLKALSPMLERCNIPFEKNSVHMKYIEYNLNSGSEQMMDMYKDGNNIYSKIEGSLDPESNMCTVISEIEGFSYVVMEDGTGYKIPFSSGDLIENDDMDFFDMDEDYEGLIRADVREYNDETCLYLENKYENENEISYTYYSLEKNFPIYIEVTDLDGNKTYSMEVLVYEIGGNYDDMFKEPEGVEWLDMGSGILNNLGGDKTEGSNKINVEDLDLEKLEELGIDLEKIKDLDLEDLSNLLDSLTGE